MVPFAGASSAFLFHRMYNIHATVPGCREMVLRLFKGEIVAFRILFMGEIVRQHFDYSSAESIAQRIF